MRLSRHVAASLVALALFTTATAGLVAHDEFRFVGRLERADVAKNVIAVKFKETDGPNKGKDVTVQVTLTTGTVITRDKKAIPKTELKAGLNVVVDALGDTYEDLEALEIRVVPPPATTK